jgi:membrane protein insertase Oxa1/YidC/SpoIIIJ
LQYLAPSQSTTPEAFFRRLRDDPEADKKQAWFLSSGIWQRTTQREEASRALVELHKSQLSCRFFDYLRTRTTLPPQYSYLFILLVLTAGAKLLSLPLIWRNVQMTAKLRKLAPELQQIQSLYEHDPALLIQQQTELLRARGVDFRAGCLVSIVDLIFVITALVTVSNYAPQLTLDHAMFGWIADVTRFSWTAVAIWCAAVSVESVVSFAGNQTKVPAGAMGCGLLMMFGSWAAIAWYWQWPAYVFLFWTFLSATTFVVSRILVIVTRFVPLA